MPTSTSLTASSQKRSPFAIPVVLGLLTAGPQHGYALFARIQNELSDVWHVGMNRLYALLEEMESANLIKGHVERAGLRPAKRVFHLTAKGRRLFERWMHEPSPNMREMRTDFPPKLYFALQRGPQDVAELIQAQRGACERELARMSGRQRDIGNDNIYRSLVYDLRVRQIHSILEWLDECEQQLVAKRIMKRAVKHAMREAA